MASLTTPNRELMKEVNRVKTIVERDYTRGIGLQELILSGVEELGEYARAVLVERGLKQRGDLTEDSDAELLDLGICGLAMYWSAGGTEEGFLERWGKNVWKPELNHEMYICREPQFLLNKLSQIQREINVLPYYAVVNRHASELVLDLIGELCYICTYGFGREKYGQYEIARLINGKLNKWEMTQTGVISANV